MGYELSEVSCDGLDNGCDGGADGALPAPPCPNQVGVCQGSVQPCGGVGGWQPCGGADYGPDYQSDGDICDRKDNDCDGTVDEGFDKLDIGCLLGVGACQAAGIWVCSADGTAEVCSAVPRAPGAEVCDYLDNNSDGAVDEGFDTLYESCSDGTGICQRFGFLECSPDGAGVVCNAVKAAADLEVCNGRDDTCDGEVDEGFCGPGPDLRGGLGELPEHRRLDVQGRRGRDEVLGDRR